MESSRTANAAPDMEINEFAKSIELFKQSRETVTTTTLSTNALCFDSGASQNNNPNDSNNNKQPGNNTSTTTKSNDTNAITSSVVANAVPTSNDIPCSATTNKNIQSLSTLSIPHTKCTRSRKSLGDAKQSQLLAVQLVSAINKTLQEVGINASEETIINQGKTLSLVDGDGSWPIADKFLKSGQGGSVIPDSSDNCTAAKVSLGYASCGLRGTHATSILQFSDRQGVTSLHKPGDANLFVQTYISVYDTTNNLLQICDTVWDGNSATSLYSTVSGGMLKDWDDGNKGQGTYPNIDDIKAAGQGGLPIGNSNTVDDPQRLLILKVTTENDSYDHTASEREDMLAAVVKAHADAAKLRMGAANGTDSLFEILNRHKNTIAKAQTLSAATRFHGGTKGVRDTYGKGPYACGPQPPDCTDRPQYGAKGKTVTLKESFIDREMKWQVENELEVLGFRDDGGRGGEDKVRYIRIISRQQFEALGVEELTRKDMGKGKKSGKKRKAAETEEDDRKPAAKRSSKRNKK